MTRGCGERKPGGCYLVCDVGSGPGAQPVEFFLVDPVQKPPAGVDLVNKATPIQDRNGIYHVFMWVGAGEYYPEAPDFIEEVRRMGGSRHIPRTFPFHLLTPGKSRMVFVHAKAYNSFWPNQNPSAWCPKENSRHTGPGITWVPVTPRANPFPETVRVLEPTTPDEPAGTATPVYGTAPTLTLTRHIPDDLASTALRPGSGPCVGKLYDLIEPDATGIGVPTIRSRPGIGGYVYTPTGESREGLMPGIFLWLPIHRVEYVQYSDGRHEEESEARARKAGFETRVCEE